MCKITITANLERAKVSSSCFVNRYASRNTVKMIAYRAETVLVALIRKHLNKEGEARALVRELLVSCADIQPNDEARTLTVRIHRMACPAHDAAISALLEGLTNLEFQHPETKARMIYTLA